jgi:hypothetical protein
MTRKHFRRYEAVSSAVPSGDAYEAVIAVKCRDTDSETRFHRVANGHRYQLFFEAEQIAEAALAKVEEIDDSGELIMA